MKFNFDNNIPIYIQLVEELTMYIVSGKMELGDRLPSVRDLALQTKVNPNTMQKALAELEEKELIYTESTNGKYVTKDKKIIEKYKKSYADELSKKYFSGMESLGYSKTDILDYLKEYGGNK